MLGVYGGVDYGMPFERKKKRPRQAKVCQHAGYRYNLSKMSPNKFGSMTKYWRCYNRKCKGWLVQKGDFFGQTRDHTICIPQNLAESIDNFDYEEQH